MVKPSSNEPPSLTLDRQTQAPGYATTEKAYAIRPKVVRAEKRVKNDRIRELIAYLNTLGDQEFTGYIKINYSQGSIGRVERFEEILRKGS